MLLRNVYHALLQADGQHLVLDLHADALERVDVRLAHVVKHLIKKLMSVRSFFIIFDPSYKVVAALRIFVNPRAFQNGLESFLGVSRYNELLVLHHVYQVIQDVKVLETLA